MMIHSQCVVDAWQDILGCFREDFLVLEELGTALPDLYRQRLTLPVMQSGTEKAPVLAKASGQSQGLCADNYLK